MADQRDVRGLRVSRSELSKRGVDTSRADVRMSHGILYIKGMVGVMKGAVIKDLKGEMELIGRVLRQKPEIRDVVLDCQYRS